MNDVLFPLLIAQAADAAEATHQSDMQSDPLMIVVMFAVAVYLFKLWLDDYRAERKGQPNPKAFPGATFCPPIAIVIAVVGALIILALETGGELALGIAGEQSDITALFLLSITAAAFVEELIFRGYLVIENKGTAALIGGVIGFSLIFTVAHPFFWDIDMPEGVPGWQFWRGEIVWDFTLKPWFSSAIVLLNSLWFYAVRLWKLNPRRSLIPCMAAHLASNLGVFVIKLAQGHVVALW